MSRRFAAVLFAAAAATACDRPTAPQVRDQIEKTQNMLFSGPTQTRMLDLDRSMRAALEQTDFFPRELIEVERDGKTEHVLATVMERTYLPVPSSGGLPYVRRTLIAWNSEAHRGFALASDDSEAVVAFPSRAWPDPNDPARLWGNPGEATDIGDGGRDAWFGNEGAFSISLGAPIGACKLKGLEQVLGYSYVDGRQASGEGCVTSRFRISAAVTFEHRNPDAGNGILDKWTTSRMTLRIMPQDVPGTRIITQCPRDFSPKVEMIFGCANRMNFWRSQTQLAPETGVDLTRMKSMGPPNQMPGLFLQTWIAGTGNPIACCMQFTGAVRYRILAPNGAVLMHAEAANASQDTVLRNLFTMAPFVRDGGRYLLFGRPLIAAPDQYTPLILDMTVLPCPAGTRRNDTSFPGNAYPDGGCYPAKNYPSPR